MDRQHDEEALDEAIAESFPASDPPANTVETGIRLQPANVAVTDHRDASRFELARDGQVAFLSYERQPGALVLVHTEVPPALRGHHLGDRLVEAALEAAHAEGLRINAVCEFARAYLKKHRR
jgi:predicted GNAT family acetyltransferase